MVTTVPATPPPRLESELRSGLIRQGDRVKAYRPLPLAARQRAFEEGIALYTSGAYFEAHEALEPAWMGTDDLAERALHQGLIKVAAACVHATRGNPTGFAKNLAGARRHLELARPVGAVWRVDIPGLIAGIDTRLERSDLAPFAFTPPVIRRTEPA
jgi:sugar phosphate isomerase/epimerase